MKLTCACGYVMTDGTSGLRHIAHFISDQELDPLLDFIDQQVIDRVASGELTREQAYMAVRYRLKTRRAFQCPGCSRVYLDDAHHKPCSFAPEAEGQSGLFDWRSSDP